MHYHGQHGARLSRGQSIYGEDHHYRSLLFSAISAVLFNAPLVHLRGIEDIWLDGLISFLPWGDFIEKLRSEWQEYVAFVSWSTFITPHGREDSHHPPVDNFAQRQYRFPCSTKRHSAKHEEQHFSTTTELCFRYNKSL